MESFDLKKTWLGLPKSMRQKIAYESGTTPHYMMTHVIQRSRLPKVLFFKKLSSSMSFNGISVTESQLAAWFYNAE
ncbi:hypothetical protein [Pectobacterium aroidearum]|uniref:hypothetical protein n=1 Tax=Pectobacterium aroidearum TaxID=1201031 RepID=UPI001CD5FF86|nr:hypothetical protein [Pectobacterium aroidearum]